MREHHTWRTLLGTLIKEPLQRQKVASELGVNPLTLTRWVEKKANPRPESLRRLLSLFPEERALLLPLIIQEFPDFSFDIAGEDKLPEEIPSAFYHQILSMLSSLPQEQMVWFPCKLILQHAFEHLDPQHQSVAVLMTQCVPPSVGNKVRSLRMVMGVGISPWGGNLEQQSAFLGADTVAGRVVSLGYPITIQNYQDPRQTGYESRAGVVSSCTYPLLYANRIIGTFGATSTLPEYFLPSRQTLIQHYATLVSTIFATSPLYALEDIELRPMPPAVVQLPYLKTLQRRSLQLLVEARERKQSITSVQAEQLVWQQLEEELLQVACLDTQEEGEVSGR